MKEQTIIEQAARFVQAELGNDTTGHDWYHSERVWKNAKYLAGKEGGNVFICEMAALLHDVADEKLNDSEVAGITKVRNWLKQSGINEDQLISIMNIISTISFKGGNQPPVTTIEAKIVQDADRLDAIGAIGIARTFAYAGAKQQLIYDPQLEPRTSFTKEEYRTGKSTAINHFYEKLLKLADLMNTETAKRIAHKRQQFMLLYLEQFFDEWESKY